MDQDQLADLPPVTLPKLKLTAKKTSGGVRVLTSSDNLKQIEAKVHEKKEKEKQ